MVVLLCLACIAQANSAPNRSADASMRLDVRRLLASGWTLRQLEDHLDLMENCQRYRHESTD
jgi:hypothetical protein